MGNRYEVTMQLMLDRGVDRLLREGPAIVLERIAYGAGACDWYLCRSVDDLPRIAHRFCPGSAVSFYFDDRIRMGVRADVDPGEIGRMIQVDGECMIGIVDLNGVDICTSLICDPSDIDEEWSGINADHGVVWGRFPGRDNDGKNAVTFVVPDEDGVVRLHPH